MIKLNELRRGNVLHLKSHGVDKKIANPYGHFHISAWGMNYPVEDFEPVSITTDWLERCGFEKGYKGVYTCDKLALEPTTDGYQPVTMGHDDYIEYGLPIKYVHELQNLYLATNRKELTIKGIA